MQSNEFNTLEEVANKIIDDNNKFTFLYAFNATGKTRLSMVFKDLVNEEENDIKKVLYFNAFTEDLFYWDNDLFNDESRKLKINLDSRFIDVIKNQGKENEITKKFQYYTNSKIDPVINLEEGEVSFTLPTGDSEIKDI
ncbi:MAG: anticodon nuclease, partial [Bacilli bacterium]